MSTSSDKFGRFKLVRINLLAPNPSQSEIRKRALHRRPAIRKNYMVEVDASITNTSERDDSNCSSSEILPINKATKSVEFTIPSTSVNDFHSTTSSFNLNSTDKTKSNNFLIPQFQFPSDKDYYDNPQQLGKSQDETLISQPQTISVFPSHYQTQNTRSQTTSSQINQGKVIANQQTLFFSPMGGSLQVPRLVPSTISQNSSTSVNSFSSDQVISSSTPLFSTNTNQNNNPAVQINRGATYQPSKLSIETSSNSGNGNDSNISKTILFANRNDITTNNRSSSSKILSSQNISNKSDSFIVPPFSMNRSSGDNYTHSFSPNVTYFNPNNINNKLPTQNIPPNSSMSSYPIQATLSTSSPPHKLSGEPIIMKDSKVPLFPVHPPVVQPLNTSYQSHPILHPTQKINPPSSNPIVLSNPIFNVSPIHSNSNQPSTNPTILTSQQSGLTTSNTPSLASTILSPSYLTSNLLSSSSGSLISNSSILSHATSSSIVLSTSSNSILSSSTIRQPMVSSASNSNTSDLIYEKSNITNRPNMTDRSSIPDVQLSNNDSQPRHASNSPDHKFSPIPISLPVPLSQPIQQTQQYNVSSPPLINNSISTSTNTKSHLTPILNRAMTENISHSPYLYATNNKSVEPQIMSLNQHYIQQTSVQQPSIQQSTLQQSQSSNSIQPAVIVFNDNDLYYNNTHIDNNSMNRGHTTLITHSNSLSVNTTIKTSTSNNFNTNNNPMINKSPHRTISNIANLIPPKQGFLLQGSGSSGKSSSLARSSKGRSQTMFGVDHHEDSRPNFFIKTRQFPTTNELLGIKSGVSPPSFPGYIMSQIPRVRLDIKPLNINMAEISPTINWNVIELPNLKKPIKFNVPKNSLNDNLPDSSLFETISTTQHMITSLRSAYSEIKNFFQSFNIPLDV